jgi:ATP-binding cassette subfamily B protein
MDSKYENINFKENWNIYYSFLKKYKGLFFSLLFLILIAEALYVSDKWLFKIVIDKGTEYTAKNIELSTFANILLIIGAIFVSLLILRVFFRWVNMHLINRLEGEMIIDLKRKFFSHIIGLHYGFYSSHKTGSLISRFSRGGRSMERMTDTLLFNFGPLTFQLIIVMFSLIYLQWEFAAIVLAIVIIFVLHNFIFQQAQKKSSIEANKEDDIEKANIGDIFTNIESIKYFGKENLIKKRFKILSENTKNAFLKNWDYFRYIDAGQALILGLGTFALIYVSIIKFINGEITIGTLAFVYTVYLGLLGPLYSFVHGVREFYRVMADFNALFEYEKITNEIKDKEGAKKLKIKKGEIHFENISFNYGKRNLFKNFNLRIKPNEKIALVGHSGSGKSTLIKLLYRFYDVNKGRILIDKKNIKDFSQESLREEMSIVPQDCILFDDTIYNNIAFSNPKAKRKEIIKAIKFAQLNKIIQNFPNKEETIVGERGIKLSGGEKQRVSIARAILANKKILVLDEATSSLDSETEFEIKKDLEKLMNGRTNIIIAHRLSTIMMADRIIVIKNGKILQVGNHKKLIKQKGEYRKLWNLQKGGYIK